MPKHHTARLKEVIRFRSPSEIRAHTPDATAALVGDNHVVRGDVIVVGGEPGAGKSTLALDLAFSGGTGLPWLELPVHNRFRTLIIQNENGLGRLKADFSARGMTEEVDAWIRVHMFRIEEPRRVASPACLLPR